GGDGGAGGSRIGTSKDGNPMATIAEEVVDGTAADGSESYTGVADTIGTPANFTADPKSPPPPTGFLQPTLNTEVLSHLSASGGSVAGS
ncbi:unnamed protein product, partial [Amoebophrya sp. A120]